LINFILGPSEDKDMMKLLAKAEEY
jgi:hypothetical protein